MGCERKRGESKTRYRRERRDRRERSDKVRGEREGDRERECEKKRGSVSQPKRKKKVGNEKGK